MRIQFKGALYHVINQGNYRCDVFGSGGKAFEAVLKEAVTMFGWVLHADVLMRNHFHLSVETPQPNLVEGMHWLQCTFATRFNRYRGERGHLFQGRYKGAGTTGAMPRLGNRNVGLAQGACQGPPGVGAPSWFGRRRERAQPNEVSRHIKTPCGRHLQPGRGRDSE